MARRSDEDFRDEIESHLANETERLIADGLSPAAAAERARRRFGSTARAQERFYESTRWMWLDRLRQDEHDLVREVASALSDMPQHRRLTTIEKIMALGAAPLFSPLRVEELTELAYASVEALLSGEGRGGAKSALPGAAGKVVTERA